jgi:uncharacterized protein YkwD
MGFNYVDFVIVLVLFLYILSHIGDGFFVLTKRLVSFVGGAISAFILYPDLAHFVSAHASWPIGIVDAMSFVIMFFVAESILKLVLGFFISLVPERVQMSEPSRALAVIPAFIDGVILIALMLFLIVIAPAFTFVKPPIASSRIGSELVTKAGSVESYLDQVFGKATEEALGFLTVKPEEGESIKLPFTVTKTSIDTESEEKMLEMVNAERAKVGAPALVMDESLRQVARAHSTDMWDRGYFAHVDPDGKDPFDRMKAVDIRFSTAGENLALAHTLERAHDGLMNSPGHKRNILDPNFRKVGMGVIDGGIYGKMFTQEFTD